MKKIIFLCNIVFLMLWNTPNAFARINLSEFESELKSNGWNSPLSSSLQTIKCYSFQDECYPKSITGGLWKHGAIDLFEPKGSTTRSTVYSIDDGEILDINRSNTTSKNMSSMYIKHTTIEGEDFMVLYGHVKANSSLVKGDHVLKGQEIGKVTVYNTPHIHFGISTNFGDIRDGFGSDRYGFINPVTYLSANKNSGCSDYSDVSLQNKYCKSIGYAKNNRIMHGYDDGRFFGNDKLINRAEFLKLVALSANIPLQSFMNVCFSDLESNTTWYTPYICSAEREGIVRGSGGVGSETFLPGDHINYAEALKIALKAYGYAISVNEDSSSNDNWYDPYLRIADKVRIDQLQPDEKIGRDFAAHLICQVHEKLHLGNSGGSCSE